MTTLNERLKELRKQIRANRALKRVTALPYSGAAKDDKRYEEMQAALRYYKHCPSHNSALRKLRSIGF